MNPTPTPPDDLMVQAVGLLVGDMQFAAIEIARLRATLAWLIETEAVMWTSDAVYQHGYGSSTIPAPDEVIAVLREVDRP